ncbi:hypothetical protein PAECIP112173_02496 [Paenibacillus sp. JJ-100]|nr:hypothetical protein PAECIP112173_02496 [Paenibacillus sp. JJ-100]
MSNKPLKISICIIVIFILAVVCYQRFQNGFSVIDVIHLFEWITIYILPWIFIFWFIRYVKKK